MVKVKDLKWRWRYGFCVYCGVPVQTQRHPGIGAPLVCNACRDLPQVDPHYAQPVDQWAESR